MRVRWWPAGPAVLLGLACAAGAGASPRPARAADLYVRTAGDDANDGRTAATAFRTIARAARAAGPGDVIIVGPGTYREGEIQPHAFGHVTFLADRSGARVRERPGDVVLDATGFDIGFELNGKLAVRIDGFVIHGAGEGIYVKSGSHECVLANNIVSSQRRNGIYVQDSRNALIFNNLVYNNGRSGILVTGNTSGSPGTRIINNTVYANRNRGIFLAGTKVESPHGRVLNNAVAANLYGGIQVNAVAQQGYVSAGNVVGDRFASGTPVDVTDVVADPGFVDPAGPDGILGGPGYADDSFHLRHSGGRRGRSPAIDAGSERAVFLKLRRASTRVDGRPDSGWVDAGYHYGNFEHVPARPERRLRTLPLYVDAARGSDDHDGLSVAGSLRTVARALEIARPGHRVVLMPGRYQEGGLNFARSGSPGREIVISGRRGAILDASNFHRGFRIVGRTHLVIENLEVTGALGSGIEIRSGFSGGVIREGARDVTVRLSRVTGNAGDGIEIVRASDVRIENTLVANNGSRCVKLSSGSVRIVGSQLTGCLSGVYAVRDQVEEGPATVSIEESGVHANGKVGVHASDATLDIRASRVTSNGSDGIRQTGGRLRLRTSSVARNDGGGIVTSGLEAVAVTDAVVAENGDNGIQVTGTDAPRVEHCKIHGNRGDGVSVLDSPAALVWNNLIYRNGSSGVLVAGERSGSPGAWIINNTFYGNGNRGLLVGGSDLKPPSPDSVVMRNIFLGNGRAGLQVNRLSLSGHVGDRNLSGDSYGPGTPIGPNDVLADPLFVNPAENDFRLCQRAAGQKVNSPGLDAGGIDVEAAGLDGRSTRTDGCADTGPVDLGFHYRPDGRTPCKRP